MKTAKTLFAIGLVVAAIGAGLSQFVLIGLIGVGLLPVAFIFLFAAGIAIFFRGDNTGGMQRLGGGLLYLGEIFLLLGSAIASGAIGCSLAMSTRNADLLPTGWQWISLILATALSAVLIIVALRHGAEWPWDRSKRWGGAGLAIVPAAFILFWIFSTVFDYTT